MYDEESSKAMIKKSVEDIYFRLHKGQDVSPGDRLRLEGKIDMLMEMEFVDWLWLEDTVNKLYQQYFEEDIDETLWQWMKADKRFYLPFTMREAPVYKS